MAPVQPSDSHPGPAGGASRTAILEALRHSEGPLTVQQLAEGLGLHANTVRFHLTRLTKDGQVREGRAGLGGPGRPKLTYEATTGRTTGSAGTAEREGNGYRLLAQILAGYLAATSDSPSRDAVAAGQEWGRHLTERPAPFSSISAEDAFDKITALMDGLGFETERSDDPPLLRLHRCPFRSVAAERPDVACSVHLGLMRGALQEMGAPLHPADLKVSHSPGTPCLALFERTGRAAPGTTPSQPPQPRIGEPETVTPPDGE
ncbi:helix-turn-helix transcriptional regulator [Streptomyces sp. NPDC020490]|uniref:helix-turn-helix transcriptional regulator n=1 Tax=Streptomyces sp. NPDC020490 TaxID=3365078 RepID=UPI0037896EDE